MAKAENKRVGDVQCLVTGEVSPVKISNNNRLYYHNKGVGIMNPLGPEFQIWLKNNAVFFENYSYLKSSAPGAPLALPAKEVPNEAEKEELSQVEIEPPKKKGLIESIFGEW